MRHARTACAVLFLFQALSAFAFESRFEIDRSLKLDELARSGKISVRTVRERSVYRSDASAVLTRASLERLQAAAADFDHYQEMGMPNVRASCVVSRAGDHLYIWTHMAAAGQDSRHYLEVRIEKGLAASGASGIQWQLTRRQGDWKYPDDPAFERLDGSWYMEPLPGGAVYVRYFLAAVIDTGVPDFIVDWVAKRQFSDGVVRVIEVLARQAAVGH
jgi:hypothetical protein